MNPGMFSSNKDDWETPWRIFDLIQKKLGVEFTLDPCATEQNTKCARFLTVDDDGLATPWGRNNIVFVNPPYGRQIGKWVEKSYDEAQNDNLVVMLIPSRTDTMWWHNYVMKAHEIWFVDGRVKFSGVGPAPFPSAVVIFGRGDTMPLISSFSVRNSDG